MSRNCEECGAETSGDNKYCSRECINESMKNKEEVSCDNCGATFKRHPSNIKDKVFCDKKCMGEYSRNKKEVVCENCDESFYKVKSELKDKNFCGKQCVGEYLSRTVEMACENCGKTVKRRPSTAGEKAFCDKSCQIEHISKEKSEKTYPDEFDKKLREKIRERDLYTCQICGVSQEKCKEKHGALLDIHHMDEDKTNNDKDNLVALCRSCHGSMKKEEQAKKLLKSKNTMGYKKGYRRENQCRKLLEKCGFEAERSYNPAYSSGDYFGLFDLIAIKADKKPRLIQVKSNTTNGALKEILEAEFIPENHFQVEVWIAHDGEGWRVKRMVDGDWKQIVDERNQDENFGEYLKKQYS